MIFLVILLVAEVALTFVPIKNVEPELEPYYYKFLSTVYAHCENRQVFAPNQLTIKFSKGGALGERIIGVCRNRVFSFTIEIDKDYWYRADESDRLQLMTHELSHCVLGLDHVDNIDNYMSSRLWRLTSDETNAQLEENLRKLCGR